MIAKWGTDSRAVNVSRMRCWWSGVSLFLLPLRVNSADAGSQLALDPREEARLRELLNETATQDADCRDKDTRSDRSAAPR